ncbi:Nn.00g015550.m01.CDS01 [Neocucurbitaria sp. VM-36]
MTRLFASTTMLHSVLLTPRSSPGSTPSADIAQTCPLEAFTKTAAFICGASWKLLSSIMYVESGDELRNTLARINPSVAWIQPSMSLTTKCHHIHNWLRKHGERGAASKDAIPLSLVLLLKFRNQVCSTGALLEFDDGVWTAVAFKIAYGNTSDEWMTMNSWEKRTGVPGGLLNQAEFQFLKMLNYRT